MKFEDLKFEHLKFFLTEILGPYHGTRYNFAGISLYDNSPLHIGPSILNSHQSREAISGGEYHINVQSNDQEYLEAINLNLDFLKERNRSLKKAIQNQFNRISKKHRNISKRQILDNNRRRQNGRSGRSIVKSWKWVCRLGAIMAVLFCTISIMNGITIQLSNDNNKNLANIKEISEGMKLFQDSVKKVYDEQLGSKTTTTIASSITTSPTPEIQTSTSNQRTSVTTLTTITDRGTSSSWPSSTTNTMKTSCSLKVIIIQ